jgi:sugar-phosphatase
MKYTAAIFDMDGLLIDSEPLWQEAEKKIFSSVGLQLTTAMCEHTMGMRLDEVVLHWFGYQPWEGKSLKSIEEEILTEVARLIRLKGTPLQGVHEVLRFCRSAGLKMAVASSSYLDLIEAVLAKLEVRDEFEVVHSAQFEPKGKPDPGIYLSTARMLGVEPCRCIAFEDSYNGLLAAKSAGMLTVAVPAPQHFNDRRFLIADAKIRSLLEFDESVLSGL